MARFKALWRRFTIFAWKRFGMQHWVFLFVQAGIAVAAVIFWIHLPPPGWAVALLAGVAAAMSIHVDMRGWQKALWMLLIGVLLVIELRAISKDRRDSDSKAQAVHDQQQQAFQKVLDAQDKDFKATAKSLTDAYAQSQQQFETTMRQSKTIFGETKSINALSTKNLIAITGGRDRPYFELSFDGNMPGRYYLSLSNTSDHAYRGLQAQIEDVNKIMNLYDSRNPHAFFIEDQLLTTTTVKIGDVGISQAFTMQHQLPDQRGNDLVYLRIYFTSLTGFWGEDIIVRKDKSGKAYRAIRRVGENGMIETIDPGFPMDSKGAIGW